jgi:YHS domain-containing protein
MNSATSRFFKYSILPVAFVFAIACKQGDAKTEKPAQDTTAMKTGDTLPFDHMLVDNKKDPACGMPVTAGISDTTHYKDHTLGFCSKECKDAFLKSPDVLIAAADLKK